MSAQNTLAGSFTDFFLEVEPRLRIALIAVNGVDAGRDAAAEALVYAWEHWDRIRIMDNPAGYLYRVGRTHARKARRRPPQLPPVGVANVPHVEPKLPDALERLSDHQRAAVILVHCMEWTHAEVADLLGVARGTVQIHLKRGMRRLRSQLGVTQ